MVVLTVPLFTNVTTLILLDPAFTAPKLTRDIRALCAIAEFVTVRKENTNTRRVATRGNRLISFYLPFRFGVFGLRI